MKIILASGSPRRREIMDLAGIDYEIMVSDVDETFEEGLELDDQSKRLAFIKAKAIYDNTWGDRAIIGSDTMVVKGDKVYVFNRIGELVSDYYKDNNEGNDYDSLEDNSPSIYDNPYYNDNLDMDQQSIEFWNSL